jgi:cysteine desulfuration protein SufE
MMEWKMDLAELKETFDLLPDWMARYGVIIDLGKGLPDADAELHQDRYKVRGCMSQVWLRPRLEAGLLHFDGDSDAAIVRGLIALLLLALSGRPPAEILAFDLERSFADLGLSANLSPNRRNGFTAMVVAMKQAAAEA